MQAMPGAMIPVRNTPGVNLADNFVTLKTATLSGEIQPFSETMFEAGQFVTGALPSIYGGTSQGQGKTASQYAMSRDMALQRLQTNWKMLNIWWKTIFGKAIPRFMKEVKDDEKFVTKDKKSGDFVNVFIRKSELTGKIGDVELESSEQLPMTFAQKQDMISKLTQTNVPQIMSALFAPENMEMLVQTLGMDEFNIPGDDDRRKQYEEIKQLLDSTPIPSPMPGMGQSQQSSVQVEPLVDNHMVEADICRRWLVSEAGRLAKVENPQGYLNVMLHMQQHMQMEHAAGQPLGQAPDEMTSPDQQETTNNGGQQPPGNPNAGNVVTPIG
jgi:hypothetical protein